MRLSTNSDSLTFSLPPFPTLALELGFLVQTLLENAVPGISNSSHLESSRPPLQALDLRNR